MTEAEWLACEDPIAMIDFVQGQTTARKLRLFAVSAARSVWDRIPPGPLRDVVALAEEIADGLALPDETAYRRAGEVAVSGMPPGGAVRADEWLGISCLCLAAGSVDLKGRLVARLSWNRGLAYIGPGAISLLRCVFGNPFRPVAFALEWRTDTAVTLARTMYESRDFGALPILADALQDAGCDSAEVLDHCRGPGPHVRGCWVVDLVLGKE